MTNVTGVKVYIGQPVIRVFPLVVLTAGLTFYLNLFSEYFIFLNDDECSYFPRRFVSNVNKDTAQRFDIGEEYMIKHALSFAESKLSDYLYEKYKSTKERIYIEKNFDLKETSDLVLINFYLTGTFAKQYEKMNRHTESSSLKKFIEEIFQVPKIIESKLNEIK